MSRSRIIFVCVEGITSKKLEYFKRSKKGRGITQLKNIISSNRSVMLFLTFMAISHFQ